MSEATMPGSVFIWPRMFVIKNEPVPGTDDMGQISLSSREIYVTPGKSRQEQALTLCHEVVHAMCATTGARYAPHEESLAGGLAQMIYALIRDNPDFVRYIQDVGREDPAPSPAPASGERQP